MNGIIEIVKVNEALPAGISIFPSKDISKFEMTYVNAKPIVLSLREAITIKTNSKLRWKNLPSKNTSTWDNFLQRTQDHKSIDTRMRIITFSLTPIMQKDGSLSIQSNAIELLNETEEIELTFVNCGNQRLIIHPNTELAYGYMSIAERFG